MRGWRVLVGAVAVAAVGVVATDARAGAIYLAEPPTYGLDTSQTFSKTPVSDLALFQLGFFLPEDYTVDNVFVQELQDFQQDGDPNTQSSFATPYIADFAWTVNNDSGEDWTNAYLMLLRVENFNFTKYPGLEDGVGFDEDFFELIDDSNLGLLYLASELGDVPNGGSKTVTIRYVIAGDLYLNPVTGQQELPPIETFIVSNPVPEPTTPLLIGVGFGALAALRRRTLS
jgi:hypothetical protein